jgi:transposase
MVADIKALFEARETPMSLREIQNAIGYGSLSTVHKYLRIAKVSSRSFVPFRVCGKSKDELAIISKEFFKRLNNFSDSEIICIDETGFSNSGNKLTGYFAKGKTPATFRVKRREKVSVALAVSIHGPVSFQIQEKAFSTHSFLQFLKDMIPSLNPSIKAIIMDNIAFHRNEAVKKLLRDADLEILYIPPYTPCCNPIEEVFAAIKRVYYKEQVIDRNIELRERVNALMNDRKAYKDFLCYYRHTRSHEKCLCQQSNEGSQS